MRTTIPTLTVIAAVLLTGCAATPTASSPPSQSRATATTQPTATQSQGPTESPSQTPSESPSPPPTTEAPTPTPAPAVLTVKNNRELAAIMAVKDYCSEKVANFATKYQGRAIAFNGSIAAMSNHEDATTRYDILLAPGDRGSSSTTGPALQFRDVNMSDLNLTGPDVPESLGVDDKLRVVAQVDEYNSTQCLFFLTPISTQAR